MFKYHSWISMIFKIFYSILVMDLRQNQIHKMKQHLHYWSQRIQQTARKDWKKELNHKNNAMNTSTIKQPAILQRSTEYKRNMETEKKTF